MRDRTKKSVKWGTGIAAIIYMLVVGFDQWSKKYAISFAPPIFIYVAYHMWLGRIETVEEKMHRERLAIRMEKHRQKDSRIAFEQGRQHSLTAKRRQAVQQAHQTATREDKKRPLTVMVII